MPAVPKSHDRSIVLIDDNPDDLLLISRSLKKAGVTEPLSTFQQPAAALAFLNESAWSRDPFRCARTIVFCDLNMPELDGFAVLQRIRTQRDSATISVIIVSGCALQSDVERARELGANGYLEKMPSPETLASAIETPTFPATGSRPELFESWEASVAKTSDRKK